MTKWALALGLDMAKSDNHFTVWSRDSLKIVLDQVELDEVEHYLSRYEVSS